VAAAWTFGLASTWWLRDDIDVGASQHFRSGTILLLLLTGSAVTARGVRHGAHGARSVHPWLGAAAALLAAAQFATGLRMMP
jgi:hypothetical protein